MFSKLTLNFLYHARLRDVMDNHVRYSSVHVTCCGSVDHMEEYHIKFVEHLWT